MGPTIWMDTVDQKVEAYNAWRDVGRELVRASQLQQEAPPPPLPAGRGIIVGKLAASVEVPARTSVIFLWGRIGGELAALPRS